MQCITAFAPRPLPVRIRYDPINPYRQYWHRRIHPIAQQETKRRADPRQPQCPIRHNLTILNLLAAIDDGCKELPFQGRCNRVQLYLTDYSARPQAMHACPGIPLRDESFDDSDTSPRPIASTQNVHGDGNLGKSRLHCPPYRRHHLRDEHDDELLNMVTHHSLFGMELWSGIFHTYLSLF
jgi:hypothetical protein